MNLRIRSERTPARRLAAVLRTYLNLFVDPPPHVPDYADIAHDIELYVNREEFRMRKEEIDLAMNAFMPIDGDGGNEAREYFRHRAQMLEALMHQNEQEIERSGILSLRRRTVTVIRRFFT